MKRKFSSKGMVSLPRLNASSAAALGQQLLTVAKAEAVALPLPIERPRARLAVALSSLEAELRPTQEADGGVRRVRPPHHPGGDIPQISISSQRSRRQLSTSSQAAFTSMSHVSPPKGTSQR
jgi:hypothetical protein